MKLFDKIFLKLFKSYPPFKEERAWSYLTSSYINMGLNPFQPNPHGLLYLFNLVFSSKNFKVYLKAKVCCLIAGLHVRGTQG